LRPDYADESEWPGTAAGQAFPEHFLEELVPVMLGDLELPAPSLVNLIQTVSRHESALLAVERRRFGRVASLAWAQRWLRSGMPVEPSAGHLERLRREWTPDQTGPPARQLIESLAVLVQALEESETPSFWIRVARLRRRGRRVRRDCGPG
jgi:hypothetical protein